MNRQSPIVLEALASALVSFRWIVLLLFGVYLLSNTTIVQPGEIALVLRLGRLRGNTREEQVRRPGLLFALPSPIDRVIRVPVKEEGEVLVQDLWRSLTESAATGNAIDPVREGYCLTGDQNILQPKIVAKYRIDDPVAFALAIEEPNRLVHDAVMTAATTTIAAWHVDDALRLRDNQTQEHLAMQIQRSAQHRLDESGCGLLLSALEFKEMHPPRHVRAEFERAQSARVQKDTMRREAEGFAASEIPKAEAERNRLVKEAQAASNNRLAQATAEIAVFRSLHDEYRYNPRLAMERIYREALQDVVSHIGKRYLLTPRTGPGDVRIIVSEAEAAP
jgi:modulator of FtsH protease HflK